MKQRQVGLTRDVGWNIGVSRTVPVDVQTAWDFLTSPEGLSLWLGDGVEVPLEVGAGYQTAAGASGEFRSVRPLDRVRLTWQPRGRATDATVQVAVVPAPAGSSIRFHTERLASAEERESMRSHWVAVQDRVRAALSPELEQPRA